MDTQRAFSSGAPVIADELFVGEREFARAQSEARFFLRLSQHISSNLSAGEALARVSMLLADVIPIDSIAMVLRGTDEPPQVIAVPHVARDSIEYFFLQRVAQLCAPKFQSTPGAVILDVRASGLEHAPAQAAVAAPLTRHDEMVGALIVTSNRAQVAYAEQDRQLITAVAQQIAIVLERERAVEEARRRMDRMGAFSAVASTVREWVDMEQLARRFLPVFLNITQTQYGLFYLLRQDNELELAGHFGIPFELIEFFQVGQLSLNEEFKNVVEQGRMAILQEANDREIGAQARTLVQLVPIQALLLVPLRVKGSVIGLIALGKHTAPLEIADREFVQGLADQAAQAIENARLFAESQRRFQEQSALRELAQRFLAAVSPDEVLERTLEMLTNFLAGEFYEILLSDNGGGFALTNGRGWRRGVVGHTHTLDDPHFHAGYVVSVREPVTIENFSQEKNCHPSDYLVRHQIVSGVCAPMLTETRAIGLLGVYSRSARKFSQEQAHFLNLVATQTAMALEKARHSQQAERRLEELILLNEVIVSANTEVSLERVVSSVTVEIGEILQSSQVHVAIADENGQGWRAIAPSGTLRALDWAPTVSKWAMASRQALSIADLARDARFDLPETDVRACLVAPMLIHERVIGTIAVAHSEPNTYDANDLRLLTTLAGQIAAALERARLLDETRARLADISAMFEFSNALRMATTEVALVELVVRDAVEMLKARGGSLLLLSENENELRVVAVSQMNGLGRAIPRELGGLSWEALARGETFAVEDVVEDARVKLPAVPPEMHGAIVAPLHTPSGVLGSLFVGFEEVGEPSADKMRLTTTIANLTTQALQRLRLHAQTLAQAESLASAFNELEESYQATLRALSAALDARDRETEGHSQRVTKLALKIGKQLELTPQELTNLERGALLHDVGKIGISDNILLKAGPLTARERARMNQHPQLGYAMLKGIPFLQEALPVVLHHQEMFDGSGYPSGLRGEEIPLGARIFAVADTYDAMTSTRPYRNALSHQAALAEIVAQSGKQFDPRVVQAFLDLFAEQSN